MKPRINVLTIGVDDLAKSIEFYRTLGLVTDGIVGAEFEYGAVAFFELQHGLQLALWPRKSIAHDARVELQKPSSTEFTIGHNVNSVEDVDATMKAAQDAGAIILKAAATTFWGGYAGYFSDLDGHIWEAVYNPELKVED